ncbi:hypothetical protein ABIE56_000409 [Luteibacter sp. 621]
MPPGKVTYRMSEAITSLTVTQTLACTKAAQPAVVEVISVNASTTYRASNTLVGVLDLGTLGGGASKSEASVELKEDGRLSGINASGEGQGLALVKAALTVIAPLTGRFGALGVASGKCGAIQTIGTPAKKGAPPVVTLTYAAVLSYTPDGNALSLDKATLPQNAEENLGVVTLKPDGTSAKAAQDLGLNADAFKITLTAPTQTDQLPLGGDGQAADSCAFTSGVAVPAEGPAGFVPLALRAVSNRVLTVTYNDKPAWQGWVAVPDDRCYAVLLPKPSTWGARQFELTLGDSGRITHLKHGGTPGGADALGAMSAVLGALPTDESRAKAAQGEADLLYQQQRLAACRADPGSCSK